MKKLIAGFALAAGVLPTSFALAATPTAISQETRVATCTERVANIPTFLADLETRHSTNSAKMQTGIDRLTAFIVKAKDAGSDTAALEANLAALISLQSDIETDRDALVAQLTSLESFVCSDDTLDEWKAARETTQANFDALKADIADIMTLRSEIKVNVQTILDTVRE
jgi:hypothetical protein